MITHKLIDQFVDTGIAKVPIEGTRSIPNARALLQGVGMTLGAKIRTWSVEHQKHQGVTHVIGEIEHGATDSRGCYICRKAAERLARIGWVWTFNSPLEACSGTIRRVLNDDPERGLELSADSSEFLSAERAAKYLTGGN